MSCVDVSVFIFIWNFVLYNIILYLYAIIDMLYLLGLKSGSFERCLGGNKNADE